MKKQILLPLLFLCVCLSAQNTNFGVKAGYSLSTISLNSTVGKLNYDPKSSFYIGAIAEYNINEKFSIQGELLYSTIGGIYKTTSTIVSPGVGTVEVNVEDEISYGTLQIPLLAKYYASESIALAAGVNMGLIISAKDNYKDSSGLNNLESDIKKNVNTLNIAPLLGLEYHLKNKLFFDARYNFGVSNISKVFSKETSNFFQIGIGYKFK